MAIAMAAVAARWQPLYCRPPNLSEAPLGVPHGSVSLGVLPREDLAERIGSCAGPSEALAGRPTALKVPDREGLEVSAASIGSCSALQPRSAHRSVRLVLVPMSWSARPAQYQCSWRGAAVGRRPSRVWVWDDTEGLSTTKAISSVTGCGQDTGGSMCGFISADHLGAGESAPCY